MKNLILTCICSAVVLSASAQQLGNSNFYNYNLYSINAAMAGSAEQLEATLSHRLQWVGLNGAPTSDFLAIHTRLSNRIGIGAKLVYDKTDIISRLSAMASAAYRLQLGENSTLSVGASVGVIQNAIRFSESVVFDPLDDLVSGGNMSAMALNAELAAVYTHNRLSLGASVQQLPETSFNYELPGNSGGFDLNRQYDVFGHYSVPVSPQINLNPTAIFRWSEGGTSQADLIAEAEWKEKVKLGLGYRTGAGVITQFGMKFFEQLIAAYSFEIPAGGVSSSSSGSHEFMIGIQLNRNKKDRDLAKEEPGKAMQKATDSIAAKKAVPEEPAQPKPAEIVELKEQELKPEVEPVEDMAEAKSMVEEDMPDVNVDQSSTTKDSSGDTVDQTTNLESSTEVVPEEVAATTEVVKEEEELNEPKQKTTVASKKGEADLNLFDQTIQFDLDETTLSSSDQAFLRKLATEAKNNDDFNIVVRGHTCDLGGPIVNSRVAKGRAQNVYDALVAEGVNPERLEMKSMQDKEPLVPNTSIENRRKNRRVDFVLEQR